MAGIAIKNRGKSLILVHTVPALVETFSELLSELAPDIPVRHVIRKELLEEALDAGELTPEIRRRTSEALLEDSRSNAAVVLCTCSTVGPAAEDAAKQSSVPILRVDRPMAESAVRIGTQITVTATLLTTLRPTLELLADAARNAGREVQLKPILFDDARAKLLAGDSDGYLAIVVDDLHQAAQDADVIVLAQASMAPALERCGDINVPILTSPRMGVEAAIQTYRNVPPEFPPNTTNRPRDLVRPASS